MKRGGHDVHAVGGFGPLRSAPYIQVVKRGWLLRLKATLLVAVMLSGGERMPFLDIALFHAGAPSHAAGPHFDTQGAPHSHGDLCRLSSALAYSPRAEPSHPGQLVVPESLVSESALRENSPRPADFAFLPPTRAPPTLSA